MFAAFMLAAAMVLSLPPSTAVPIDKDGGLCDDGTAVVRNGYATTTPGDVDISVFTDMDGRPLMILHWAPGPEGKPDAAAVYINGKLVQMTMEQLRAAYKGPCDLPDLKHGTRL